MEILKYAILGMLYRNDMTGYELKKALESTLFEFWPARHSQIYPELKHLYEQGMIDYSIEISGTVLEKKKYHMTEEGKTEFLKWEKSIHPGKAVTKDEFRLQLFFSDALEKKEKLLLLEEQLQFHRQYLDDLHEKMKRFDSVSPSDSARLSDYMVIRGAVYREEAACQWISECRSILEQQDEN